MIKASDAQRHREIQALWIRTARRALRQHYRSVAVALANKYYDKQKGNNVLKPMFEVEQSRTVDDVANVESQYSAKDGTKNKIGGTIANKLENALLAESGAVVKLKNSENVRKLNERLRNMKVVIEPIGLFLVAILYACVGGGVYYALEHRNEKQSFSDDKVDVDAQIKAAAINLSNYFSTKRSPPSFNKNSSEAYVDAVVRNLVSDLGAYPDSGDYDNWSYAGCVWFAITIFTTIGYGNYAPKTVGGRVFTIFYALVGIPMMLLVLSETGKMFAWALKKIYNSCARCYVEKIKNKKFGSAKNSTDAARQDISQLEPVASEIVPMETPDTSAFYSQEQLESFDFPIVVSVLLLIAWILLVSAVSYSHESFENSYFNNIYFWMITLTTIGLGDFTPKRAVIAILCFPFFVIGLSLLSMIITMLQVRMEEMEELILDDYLGFGEDEEDDAEIEAMTDDERDKCRRDLADELPGLIEKASHTKGSTLGIFQAQSQPDNLKHMQHLQQTLDAWKKKKPIFGQPKEPNKVMVPKEMAKLIKTLGAPGNVKVKRKSVMTQTDCEYRVDGM